MTTNGLDSKPKGQNKVIVVLGAQWGDEGKVGASDFGEMISQNSFNSLSLICCFQFLSTLKGKIVDLIALHADIVCRCQVSVPSSRLTKFTL